MKTPSGLRASTLVVLIVVGLAAAACGQSGAGGDPLDPDQSQDAPDRANDGVGRGDGPRGRTDVPSPPDDVPRRGLDTITDRAAPWDTSEILSDSLDVAPELESLDVAPEVPCPAPCPELDETACVEEQFIICEPQAGGCPAWSEPQDCDPMGLPCVEDRCDEETGECGVQYEDGTPCGDQSKCLDGECTCLPACAEGNACGPDGCGGSCGTCPSQDKCDDGMCILSCLDGDGDQYGDGPDCLGTDCDDDAVTCATDCDTDTDQDQQPDCADTCLDGDLDGYGDGPGCAGLDCDDGAPACTLDCETDTDGDQARDCDDPCVDVDGDGYGQGPGCVAADCDDGTPTCDLDCITDLDLDAVKDCEDPCVDGDGDGFGLGTGCLGLDCDPLLAGCTTDCASDADLDGLPDCADPCVDVDSDGYGSGDGCLDADCDDQRVACALDCTDSDLDQLPDCADPCIDLDGDGFGAGADCVAADCLEGVATCTVDCSDGDGDQAPDCETGCLDMDGDGWGIGPTCDGPDCDETWPWCFDSCALDTDDDGVPDCKDGCTDIDGDGYGAVHWGEDGETGDCLGEDCWDYMIVCNVDCKTFAFGDADNLGDEVPHPFNTPVCYTYECTDEDEDLHCAGIDDCDDQAPNCRHDCTADEDGDGLRDCDDPCVDVDGDGFGASALADNGSCAGVDCDDDSPYCNVDCSDGDVDLDGVTDCTDPCVDPDGDGFGIGIQCAGLDCSEAHSSCNQDCVSDYDGDGIWDCLDLCQDLDEDGTGEGPDCPATDCDDMIPTCQADCLTDVDADEIPDCADGCLDGDGDGYGQLGGAAGDCLGEDCDDANDEVHPGVLETCDGVDEDCDGDIDEGGEDGLIAGDVPLCENQAGVCQGAVKPAAYCLDGQWQACDDPLYAQHHASYQAGQEESCDTLDNDCSGEVDEDFPIIDLSGQEQLVGESCGAGVCAGGSVICDELGTGAICTTHGEVGTEICNSLDDDCDGASDAEDGADLIANDAQPCEIPVGVCAVEKPASLCVEGLWEPCTAETYLAVAEGFEEGIELSCADELDNDCDGVQDCFDPDCFGGVPGCEEEWICDDGLDNDGDGLFDCEDPDCLAAPCDDAEPCTFNETCQPDETCGQGTEHPCDDGVLCTADLCTGDGDCDFSQVVLGWCRIDGICHEAGESPPDNSCAICAPDWGAPFDTTWAWRTDFADCDDGDTCSTGDFCDPNYAQCVQAPPSQPNGATCAGGICCGGECRLGGNCCDSDGCLCSGPGNVNCTEVVNKWICEHSMACFMVNIWNPSNPSAWYCDWNDLFQGCNSISRESCHYDSPWCWLEYCINFTCQ